MASNLTRRGTSALLTSNTGIRGRAQDRGPTTTYLAFRLAENFYATPLSLIREILVRKPLTPVPRAHPSIMGIISNRGQLITVFDLRKRLRLSLGPETSKGRILTTNPTGIELIGLYVDEVTKTYKWTDAEIDLSVVSFGNEVSGHIAGIARPKEAEGPLAGRSGKRVASGPKEKEPSEIILLDFKAILAT
jgi:purine-binding chemotaxis protein CheW